MSNVIFSRTNFAVSTASEPEDPVLLWVHVYDPHQPYDPPREFRREIDREIDFRIAGLGRAYGGPEHHKGALNRLYRNDGSGSFTSMTGSTVATGGGKSLCFQAPVLLDGGLAVVVSPLISLMKDQVDALRGNGVAAAYDNSTLLPAERDAVREDALAGRLRLPASSPFCCWPCRLRPRMPRTPCPRASWPSSRAARSR